MQAKWYVYRLIDPRTGEPFYVGKGSGDRIRSHEREAMRGVCSRKTSVIKEIWFANLSVEREHVAFFFCEKDAYDFETDLIEEIGLERLTNIQPGGAGAWRRRLKTRKAEKLDQRTLSQRVASNDYDRIIQVVAALLKNGRLTFAPRFSCFSTDSFSDIAKKAFGEWLPSVLKSVVEDAQALSIFNQRLADYGVCLNGRS